MAFSKLMRNTMLLAVSILIFCSTINSSKVISEEVLSRERMHNRVKVFNEWYAKLNPNAKVEAKLSQDATVLLAAKADLKAEDAYLTVNRNMIIHAHLIYETKIGDFVKSLEEKYGYDDTLNMAFYLLNEMGNPESKWRPYLDILPRKPESFAFNYWNRKAPIEEELLNTPVLKKIVDYKLLTERKAQAMFSLVQNNTDFFNLDVFTFENLEWACFTLDSKQIAIDFETFLVPMLDLVQPKESAVNPSRLLKLKFEENGDAVVRAMADFSKGQPVFENFGLSSDDYLIYKGTVLENNFHDCYSVSASFNDKAEDGLKEFRKIVFARYFLFDSNVSDNIEECVSTKDPFNRRLLFFYYISMLDEIELEKEDIKRFDLEGDRIVLEYVKNAFQSLLDLYPTKLESDLERVKKANIEPDRKLAITYLIEQKKYLIKLIEIYDNEISKLVKEDTL